MFDDFAEGWACDWLDDYAGAANGEGDGGVEAVCVSDLL
jgi:hypothetical protein